uniref:Small ribosomal subunit protein uS3c n=4 Tax=Cephalotaxus TaxID=50178 RepID=A0A2P1AEP2_9CONI|nr:ribosomal protein S3 [Cephalotaxus sinensis]YP_009641713.1 ribosomal protein S3 [Cephalotaxus hainanensis]YP_010138121.1 ribosomal protein S3 [Cephalotaxus griffithii]YP_010138367.1 ribosomal protein S3 [Cephalotaxus harringtonia var. nana]UPV70149.1 ribosomal protein S3 [Cephalotaxus fortunei]UPV71543.1 ribosomal protein S3 [Cephalotaxus fortunei var. alpina]AVI15504.1 ribosomal protein S3 [Cephalotaxus sinensis]AXI98104.1 ribosomal protein S3 [Cephalotaxus sinensis]QBZ37784.1 ribosomal
MGNKINPLGFRLGFTQNHRSFWFEERDYSEDLREDEKIHNCIRNYVRHINIKASSNYGGITRIDSNYGGITRIDIMKKSELIQINICIGFTDLFIKKQEQKKEKKIKQLRDEVENMLVQNIINSVDRKLLISIEQVDKPYREPNILAEYIALQLKERVQIKKIMKKVFELAEEADVKGIKIQIKGRLNGIERARKQSAMQGRVPLQTLRAKIDYCYYAVQTVYGVLGIKIWIFV